MFKFTLNDKSYTPETKESTKEQKKAFIEKSEQLLFQIDDLAKENNINYCVLLHTEDTNEEKIQGYINFCGDFSILIWLMEAMVEQLDKEIFEMGIFDNNSNNSF